MLKTINSNNTQVKKNLKFSFLHGIFASAMNGFINEYLTPFILLLGGTARQIGALNAFPNLSAALIQLKSAEITEHLHSRKRMVSIFVLLQGLILLLVALSACWIRISPALFIIFTVLFTACGQAINPAWGSLLSDLVEENKRGAYFGWRNKVLGFIAVAATFLAGLILQQMKKINIFYGFAILFGLGFLWRLISWYFVQRMDEPALLYNKVSQFSLFQFLGRLKESNFAQFVLFVAAMNFAVNIASPYFSVLMLKDLKFSYLLYTLITITATFIIYLTIGRWGRIADRIGNLKIIQFTASLIGIIPLLWIINRHPLFLFGAQVFSGFVWAGFNLCTANFIYDAVTAEKRTRCIAYFSVLCGLALSLGALLGGFLLSRLPALWGYKILTLFLISALLRIVVGVLMPRKLKEVKPVETIDSNQLFFDLTGLRFLGPQRRTN